jgi:drug/metabolite transporter (DMT)-like permease
VVILALVPLFTLIFAIAHRQETFRWRAMLGALVAVGGIALVFQQQLRTSVPFFSLLAVILGAACIAESGVIAKGFPRSHPITTNAIGMSVGAIILFLMSIFWHEKLVMPVRTTTWIALIYLILFGTCAVFIMFLYILKRWPASRISYQFVLMPFVTIAASAWLTHEALSPILLAGAALVLMGVFIGVLSLPKRQPVGGLPVAGMDESMAKIIK